MKGKKKKPHSAVFENCYLPIWSLEVITHQGTEFPGHKPQWGPRNEVY